MTETELFAPAPPPVSPARPLTAAEFRGLAEVPPEREGFVNRPNPPTRRAYPQDVRDFRLPGGTTRGTLIRKTNRPFGWGTDGSPPHRLRAASPEHRIAPWTTGHRVGKTRLPLRRVPSPSAPNPCA